MSTNPPCIKCEMTDNSNGLFRCNGCRRSFCSNHIVDHSDELRRRFETLTDEYNSIYNRFLEYKQTLNEYQWKRIERKLHEIKLKLDQNEKLSNFCNKDLDDWNIRFEEIKTHMESTPIRALNIKRYVIYFSCVLFLILLYNANDRFLSKRLFSTRKFVIINGPIQLHEDGRVAEHYGDDYVLGKFRVNQNYANNINKVRFIMEKFSSSDTFIGIIGSENLQIQTPTYGWFIHNEQGNYFRLFRIIWSFLIWWTEAKHYDTIDIHQGDTIELNIDCIHSKIALKNIRTDKSEELDVRTPLPWQIWISLDRHGDRIRLL